MMKIGVVVHGPEIVDTGYSNKILILLEEFGKVRARLGGTMGRTAVFDASLEDKIDISERLLPSESIDKFNEDNFDAIFLINYGKSSITGYTFGFKVFKKSIGKPPLIQIERPGEADGTIIPWNISVKKLAMDISKIMGLKILKPEDIIKKIQKQTICTQEGVKTIRKVAGVSSGENIFVNGIVIGKSSSDNVTLVAENGILTDLIGGKLKKHGVEKIGKIDLKDAIIKTGLLRRSIVTPRVLNSKQNNGTFHVAFLNHAAEDIYKFKRVDMVITIGDDTTLVAGDILYRFKVPIIGITDGDIDKVVENGLITEGSLIVELENGWDDIIGEKIFSEVFNEKEEIIIDDIDKLKIKILKIINKFTDRYIIKDN
jgi:hypothetical protein